MVKIAPSILSADFANLERDIQRISTADYVHVDVMDGVFVPNITIGIPVVKSIRPTTTLPLDVHLMIVEPVRYVEPVSYTPLDVYKRQAELFLTALRVPAAQGLHHHGSLLLGDDLVHGVDAVLLVVLYADDDLVHAEHLG